MTLRLDHTWPDLICMYILTLVECPGIEMFQDIHAVLWNLRMLALCMIWCVCVCVCVCVRVRACVRACVRVYKYISSGMLFKAIVKLQLWLL